MCLDVGFITHTSAAAKLITIPTEGEGWKIFTRHCINRNRVRAKAKYRYGFKFQQLQGKPTFAINRWLKAEDFYSDLPYDAGFHVYLQKPTTLFLTRESRRFGKAAVKVKFRGGHTLGYQDGQMVVVASEMLVPVLTRCPQP